MQIFTTIVTKNVMPRAPFDPSFRTYHNPVDFEKSNFFSNISISAFFQNEKRVRKKIIKKRIFQFNCCGQKKTLFLKKANKKRFPHKISTKPPPLTYNTKMFRKNEKTKQKSIFASS